LELYLLLGPAVGQVLGTTVFDLLLALREGIDESLRNGMIAFGLGTTFFANLGTVLFFALDMVLLTAGLPFTIMSSLLLPGGILIAALLFLLIEAPLAL